MVENKMETTIFSYIRVYVGVILGLYWILGIS